MVNHRNVPDLYLGIINKLALLPDLPRQRPGMPPPGPCRDMPLNGRLCLRQIVGFLTDVCMPTFHGIYCFRGGTTRMRIVFRTACLPLVACCFPMPSLCYHCTAPPFESSPGLDLRVCPFLLLLLPQFEFYLQEKKKERYDSCTCSPTYLLCICLMPCRPYLTY